MTKHEFLVQLRKALSALPEDDLRERMTFYNEMLDDLIEDGLSEEEATASLGSIDDIVLQIIAETPVTRLVKEKIKPRKKLSAWVIVLLILGAPVWFSLAVSVFAVLVALYAIFWTIIISLWATFGALAGASLGAVFGGIIFAVLSPRLVGAALIAAGLVCTGITILFFLLCLWASRGLVRLTKKLLLAFKNSLFKGDAE